MIHGQLLGTHGYRYGMTIQELLDFLKSVPAKARHNYVMISCADSVPLDVTKIQFAQSDQAEKWDFKVYISSQPEVTA